MANTKNRGLRPTPAEKRYRRLLAGAVGADLAEVAARAGVRAKTLSWWRWEITRREQARHEEKRSGAGEGMPAFLPVRVVEPPSACPIGSAPRGVFGVRLGRGHEITVFPAFDADDLRRLIAVLEDLPC